MHLDKEHGCVVTAQNYCPNCNASLNAATNPNAANSGNHIPSDGDISICWHCAQLLTVRVKDNEVVGLDYPSEEDLLDAPLVELQRVQNLIVGKMKGDSDEH